MLLLEATSLRVRRIYILSGGKNTQRTKKSKDNLIGVRVVNGSAGFLPKDGATKKMQSTEITSCRVEYNVEVKNDHISRILRAGEIMGKRNAKISEGLKLLIV